MPNKQGKANYKVQSWPGVQKAIALRVLLKGPMDVQGFGDALKALRFEIKGPRKPYNILARLLSQSLVRREVSREEVSYKIQVKGVEKDVSRGCRRVRWSLTKKGRDRLKYLDTRDD